MKKTVIFCALLTTTFFLLPTISPARDYNAKTGRFMTMDTFEGSQEQPLSLNKYLYCRADPVQGTDPDGHDDIDIGSLLTSMSIDTSINAWHQVAVPTSVLFGGVGPDVTKPLKMTLDDVAKTYTSAPKATQDKASHNMVKPWTYYNENAWDIEPLFSIGRGAHLSLGGTEGSGVGARTVQYSHQGGSLNAYWAGAVNYALWGQMFRLSKDAHPHDPMYDLSVAESLAHGYKFVGSFVNGSSPTEEKSAYQFIRMGYNGTDPSSVALPFLRPNPKNIATPMVYEWHWLGLQ